MQNISKDEWRADLAGRVGATVLRIRKDRGLSGIQLSERTKALGYPIHRVAITKIENNDRAGKIDMVEVIILALALGVPPVQLIYPALPDGPVQLWPAAPTTHASTDALLWFGGEQDITEMPGTLGLPPEDSSRVALARELYQLRWQVAHLTQIALTTSTSDPGRREIAAREAGQRIAAAQVQLAELTAQIQRNEWPINDGT